MPRSVFISYARDSSRDHAAALYDALGGDAGPAFLDTEEIGVGEPCPERLVDALYDASVVVIFAEPTYFTRRYCLGEFHIACGPFFRVADRPGATLAEKSEAVRGLVLALPPNGVDPMVERFPPPIQSRNWPRVDEIDVLATLVRDELATNPPTLRERYQALGADEAERARLLVSTQLPKPQRIGKVPVVPAATLPGSIHDAFLGRVDDLWRVHHVLATRNDSSTNPARVTGSLEAMGGIGKTRLALEYLYRFGTRDWRGGLFWIDAEQDPEVQLYDVLQALNPEIPTISVLRQAPGGVRAAVARQIRALEGPPPLFVIDNLPEPEPHEPPKSLETWCPVLGEVPVLVTSRARVALSVGGSVIALPIETLHSESAVLLLSRGQARNQLSDVEWREIAESVGNLPLALELMNALISSRAMTPRAVLEMSRNTRPSETLDLGMEAIRYSVPAGALRGITETFTISYNLLTPEQQYAARLIGWMSPEPVPEFVISAFGPNVFTPAVRTGLHGRSIVTEVRDSTYFGAMHRLLAEFVLRQSPAKRDEIESVSSVLMGLLQSAERQGEWGAELVRSIAPLLTSHFAQQKAFSNGESDISRAIDFANSAGILLVRWGFPEFARELFESVIASSAARSGEEHPQTLGLMNNLAITLRDQANLNGAQELQERVLEAMRRMLGEEHPDTLTSMNNLANTLRDRGDHAGAQALQERVMEVRQRILGELHPDTLASMNNLANTLRDRGDHAGAQALREQVLKAMRHALGEEHPGTLASMNNLASALRDQGDLAGAQALQEQVLSTRRRVLGEEHPDTLTSMLNLAATLGDSGALQRERELEEKVLVLRSRILGNAHPETTRAAWHLLLTLLRLGNIEAADAVLQAHLSWLIDADRSLTSPYQVEVQKHLREFVTHTSPSGTHGEI